MARYGCEWMNNGLTELIFHADANSRKLRIIYFNNFWVAWDSNFNEWISLAEFLHTNTYLRKLKVTLIVNGWALSNMGASF